MSTKKKAPKKTRGSAGRKSSPGRLPKTSDLGGGGGDLPPDGDLGGGGGMKRTAARKSSAAKKPAGKGARKVR